MCAIRDRISHIIAAPLRRREDPLDQDCSESSQDFEVLMIDRFEAQEADLVCEGIVHLHGLIYVNTPTCASEGLGTVGCSLGKQDMFKCSAITLSVQLSRSLFLSLLYDEFQDLPSFC